MPQALFLFGEQRAVNLFGDKVFFKIHGAKLI